VAPRLRFGWWLALATLFVLALLAVAAAVVWTGADGSQRVAIRAVVQDRLSLLAALALLLPFVLAGVLRWWMHAYPLAAARLADEVARLRTTDPRLRVGVAGGQAMRQLADAINGLADVHERLQHAMQQRVAEAGMLLAQERQQLEAVMAHVPNAVLLCGADGRVRCCNPRAARLFDDAASADRSVYSLIDKRRIVHALDTLGGAPADGAAPPVARFVAARGDRLLRVHVAPVPDGGGEPAGFVLLLDDVTRPVDWDGDREKRLRQRIEAMRSSLANIRAAAETVEQYPDMDNDHRRRFTEVIRTEAERLSARLVAAAADAESATPVDDMPASDLVHALQSSFERRLHITAGARDDDPTLWVRVDSYLLVETLTRLVGRVVERCAIRSAVIELAGVGHFARLSVCWNGSSIAPEALREWLQVPDTTAEGRGLTAEDVLSRHGAELWLQPDSGQGPKRLCLQLPAARPSFDAASAPQVERGGSRNASSSSASRSG
jgi:DNA polymerase-3 subunit epsilon